MSEGQKNNPLHGVTLAVIVESLVERHGFDALAQQFSFACFRSDPSVKSTLKFLRKNEWARKQVEAFFIDDRRVVERNAKRNRRRKAQRAFRAAGALGQSGQATREMDGESDDSVQPDVADVEEG